MRNKSAHCSLPSGKIRDPRSLPFTYGRSRGELPHILKPGCTFFVTFCLIGKGAHTTNRRREKPVRQDPIDVALDSEPPRPSVNPLLALHRAARIVEEALLFFQGNRYSLHAWCVMPDHVHALVTPFSQCSLDEVVHSWKSYTSNEINKCLHRSGPLWERESFDHMVRSLEAFDRFRSYIELNPVVAGLCAHPSDWHYSSARFRAQSLDI